MPVHHIYSVPAEPEEMSNSIPGVQTYRQAKHSVPMSPCRYWVEIEPRSSKDQPVVITTKTSLQVLKFHCCYSLLPVIDRSAKDTDAELTKTVFVSTIIATTPRMPC